jgi:pyrimidine-specific ribonucleoside hydrolase
LVTLRLIDTVAGMAIPIALDMETGDPDDVFTLCALATHPWGRR